MWHNLHAIASSLTAKPETWDKLKRSPSGVRWASRRTAVLAADVTGYSRMMRLDASWTLERL